MRAPIGFRIRNRRKYLKISQAELARRVSISASYLNLIENNKRDIGGALLNRVAEQLDIGIDELAGRAEQKLLHDLEEAFADPMLQSLEVIRDERRQLVAQYPASATALARMHRAYVGAMTSANEYADRLRSDPLLSQLLHQILSGVTAIRSSAEILGDVPDLDELQRDRFLAAITRESLTLSEVARNLIGQFDKASASHRSAVPAREIDDLLIARQNYFPELEDLASDLRSHLDRHGPFGIATLMERLKADFGINVQVDVASNLEGSGLFGFDRDARTLWFRSSTNSATRRFQMARLYGEMACGAEISKVVASAEFSAEQSSQLASRALSSYLAGAMVFPYSRFFQDAEECRYDIDHLLQLYNASFEQVAHRLVTLRKPAEQGVPFGFLRSDPAGRLTKHFPLPGLLLPYSGHACPLWVIYGAFRSPGAISRQVAQFFDGSRYLFMARTVQARASGFRQLPPMSSVMLACDVLHADRTIYAAGLNLADLSNDIPVGPSCRLCTRRNCASRQEPAFSPAA